jgi:hypothetical protein
MKKRKRKEPVAVGDQVQDVMDRILPERGRLRKILALWREMLGDEVFLNARPTSIRKNELFVTISDPIWQSELRYFTVELLEKINRIMPEKDRIKGIRFRVGYMEGVMPDKDMEIKEEKRTEAVVDALPAELREPVLHVTDPALRSILARLASQVKDDDKDKDK